MVVGWTGNQALWENDWRLSYIGASRPTIVVLNNKARTAGWVDSDRHWEELPENETMD